MSGIEVLIIVGGAIYISKKVKDRKEKKRLAKEALIEGHGSAQLVEPGTPLNLNPRLRHQAPTEEDALPLYRAPTEAPPTSITDMKWSDQVHLPSYDEVSDNGHDGDDNELSRTSSARASSSASTHMASPLSSTSSHLDLPMSADKKKRFWKRHRSHSSSHTDVQN